MKLLLRRIALKPTYTIGKLYVNGEYVCDTLEDAVREEKIYGKTAIPEGTYSITMDVTSPRFKYRKWALPYGGKLPRLLDVPNYEGVLIHVGNDENDTSGCILVGKNKYKGRVVESANTFIYLMEEYLIPAKENNEHIFIEIHNR